MVSPHARFMSNHTLFSVARPCSPKARRTRKKSQTLSDSILLGVPEILPEIVPEAEARKRASKQARTKQTKQAKRSNKGNTTRETRNTGEEHDRGGEHDRRGGELDRRGETRSKREHEQRGLAQVISCSTPLASAESARFLVVLFCILSVTADHGEEQEVGL